MGIKICEPFKENCTGMLGSVSKVCLKKKNGKNGSISMLLSNLAKYLVVLSRKFKTNKPVRNKYLKLLVKRLAECHYGESY